MAEFALHVLKLNIISAVVIFLVLGLSVLLKNRFTARWKYVVWLAVAVSLLVPVRLPSDFSLINFKVPGIESSGNEKITAKRITSANADSANVNSSKVNLEDSSTADKKLQDTVLHQFRSSANPFLFTHIPVHFPLHQIIHRKTHPFQASHRKIICTDLCQ